MLDRASASGGERGDPAGDRRRGGRAQRETRAAASGGGRVSRSVVRSIAKGQRAHGASLGARRDRDDRGVSRRVLAASMNGGQASDPKTAAPSRSCKLLLLAARSRRKGAPCTRPWLSRCQQTKGEKGGKRARCDPVGRGAYREHEGGGPPPRRERERGRAGKGKGPSSRATPLTQTHTLAGDPTRTHITTTSLPTLSSPTPAPIRTVSTSFVGRTPSFPPSQTREGFLSASSPPLTPSRHAPRERTAASRGAAASAPDSASGLQTGELRRDNAAKETQKNKLPFRSNASAARERAAAPATCLRARAGTRAAHAGARIGPLPVDRACRGVGVSRGTLPPSKRKRQFSPPPPKTPKRPANRQNALPKHTQRQPNDSPDTLPLASLDGRGPFPPSHTHTLANQRQRESLR